MTEDYTIVENTKVPEQCAIGCALASPEACDVLLEELTVDSFYHPVHKKIFNAMRNVAAKEILVDCITVSEELNDESATLPYLAELVQNSGSFSNVRTYCELIKNKATLRSIARVCEEIMQVTVDYKALDISELLDRVDEKITGIILRRTDKKEAYLAKESLARIIDAMERNYHGEGAGALMSGFIDIDKMTCGFKPGELILIAGRPSMGKTAFALNIAENIVAKDKKPILIFSLEMTADSLVTRLISSLAMIDTKHLMSGKLSDNEWVRATATIPTINHLPLQICDEGSMSILNIRAQARRTIRKHPDLAMIIIDYIGLMGSDRHLDNRHEEVSIISRGLKSLAKELKVPIIALSQLNRAVEGRTSKRPIMSDLRESGSLEQDADLILLVYRDEVYNPDSNDRGTAEIIIAKQRNGPIGTVYLNFKGEYCKFMNHFKH